MNQHLWLTLSLILAPTLGYAQSNPLAKALRFHAPFDDSANALTSKGDGQIYQSRKGDFSDTRTGLDDSGVLLRPEQGKYGGAIEFTEKYPGRIFFTGADNVPYSPQPHDMTVMLWMKLAPDTGLPPGYVDPIQITDKTWNDASLFLDFTDKPPRQFRLGVFSDIKFWNPDETPWDDIPENKRPMVVVSKPPFTLDQWTHVAWTLKGINSKDGPTTATLYLDGVPQGTLKRNQQFTWQTEQVKIMLGIFYIGQFDDLALFDRALSADEIQQVIALEDGIKSLGNSD